MVGKCANKQAHQVEQQAERWPPKPTAQSREPTVAVETSKLSPSDTVPPARLHLLSLLETVDQAFRYYLIQITIQLTMPTLLSQVL